MNKNNFVSIVIIGAMNPRIHHPAWYEHSHVIGSEDLSFALDSEDLICTPPLSRFSTPNFSINCHQDRWEVQTENKDKSNDILEVANHTFKILGETPVHSYGFNFNFHRKTSCQNIENVSSYLMKSLNIGLPDDINGIAKFSYIWEKSVYKTTVTISPIEYDKSVLYIGINMHYNIEKIIKKPSKFNIDELLSRYFPDNEKEAEDIAYNIARSYEAKEVRDAIDD